MITEQEAYYNCYGKLLYLVPHYAMQRTKSFWAHLADDTKWYLPAKHGIVWKEGIGTPPEVLALLRGEKVKLRIIGWRKWCYGSGE